MGAISPGRWHSWHRFWRIGKNVFVENRLRRRRLCRGGSQQDRGANERAKQRTYRGTPWSRNEGLASYRFFDRSGRGDVGSTSRIFLQFAGQRNLVRRDCGCARRAGTGLHRFAEAFEDDPDHCPQHGDHDDRQQKLRRLRETFAYFHSIRQASALLLFLGGCFAGRVDARLRVAGGDQRRGDVHAQAPD